MDDGRLWGGHFRFRERPDVFGLSLAIAVLAALIIWTWSRTMDALETITADVANAKAASDALAAAVTGAVAELSAETAKLADLTAKLAAAQAASPDAALAALASDLEASTNKIVGAAAALAAAVPAAPAV